MAERSVFITGVGRALPGEPVTNAKILRHCNLGVNEDWVKDRIGIRTRHVSKKYPDDIDNSTTVPKSEWMQWGAREGETNSDLGARAAKMALQNAGISDVQRVGMLVVSTCTPDYPVPATATLVQEKLGLQSCVAIDIRSACTGSTLGMATAINALKTGETKIAVIIGSEVGSAFGSLDQDSDPTWSKADAINAMMIGDGAGAFVIQIGTEDEIRQQRYNQKGGFFEIVKVRNNSVGCGKASGMYLPAGGCINPINQLTLDRGLHKFQHRYDEVLRHGPELYLKALEDVSKDCNICLQDISVFIPHQANGKIGEIASRLGLPTNRIFMNFGSVGNTANASVMLCLADMIYPRPNQPADSSPELLCENLLKNAYILAITAESTKWLYGYFLLRYIAMDTSQLKEAPKSGIIGKLTARTILWIVKSVLLARSRLLGAMPFLMPWLSPIKPPSKKKLINR